MIQLWIDERLAAVINVAATCRSGIGHDTMFVKPRWPNA